MEKLCPIYRFIVLSPVPCLSRSIKRPGLPRMRLVTNGTRFSQRKFLLENFRIFLYMENARCVGRSVGRAKKKALEHLKGSGFHRRPGC